MQLQPRKSHTHHLTRSEWQCLHIARLDQQTRRAGIRDRKRGGGVKTRVNPIRDSPTQLESRSIRRDIAEAATMRGSDPSTLESTACRQHLAVISRTSGIACPRSHRQRRVSPRQPGAHDPPPPVIGSATERSLMPSHVNSQCASALRPFPPLLARREPRCQCAWSLSSTLLVSHVGLGSTTHHDNRHCPLHTHTPPVDTHMCASSPTRALAPSRCTLSWRWAPHSHCRPQGLALFRMRACPCQSTHVRHHPP
jgi:hypothetical protein